MFGKLQISGDVVVKTGMHIGGSTAFAAIGAVDSPVIKDVRTGLPMIPGSSLKGKMRTLLAKEYNEQLASLPDDDDPKLLRLFGSAKKDHVHPSRIIFSDLFLSNSEGLRRQGLQSMTEIKFENGINRATAVANPRQIERAVRGSIFELNLIYDITDEKEALEDLKLLAEGMKLLQYDYLGGHGSRGYGKVAFENLSSDVVVGDYGEEFIDQCNEILEKVSS